MRTWFVNTVLGILILFYGVLAGTLIIKDDLEPGTSLTFVSLGAVVLLTLYTIRNWSAFQPLGRFEAFGLAIKHLPSTNFRIFVSVLLSVVFVIGTMVLVGLGTEPSEYVLAVIAAFLLAMMGLDVTQFAIKRKTHDKFAPGLDPEAPPPTDLPPAAS